MPLTSRRAFCNVPGPFGSQRRSRLAWTNCSSVAVASRVAAAPRQDGSPTYASRTPRRSGVTTGMTFPTPWPKLNASAMASAPSSPTGPRLLHMPPRCPIPWTSSQTCPGCAFAPSRGEFTMWKGDTKNLRPLISKGPGTSSVATRQASAMAVMLKWKTSDACPRIVWFCWVCSCSTATCSENWQIEAPAALQVPYPQGVQESAPTPSLK
mmetsp:Transcript_83296/g.232284  ORF Transcript_83296/g.232284 Transcript_83296/m.232284 type:complete len:210 (-) Transcript_83296:1171-1800(-)